MKVVLLAPTPPPVGGIARWTVRMMNSELKNSWTVEVVDEKLGEERELFGNKTKKSIFVEIKRCFRIWRDLKEKLKDREAVVVHSCIPSFTLSMIREYVCALITKSKKRAFILHFRSTVPNSVKGKTSKMVLKLICNKSDRILVLNEQSKKFVEGFTDTPVEVIPNFVDSKEISTEIEIRDEIKSVAYVGGVIESKGCADIIEVAKAFPQITFYLVGSASAVIEQMAGSLNNVVLTGVKNSDEVKALLRSADVFMFLSYFQGEGFSNALAEAMAIGLPCIVSDWAANRDMIEDKGGCVVPIKSPKRAEEALKSMMPQEIRRAFSQFNLEKARSCYSDKAVLSQYVDVYEKTINKIG